MTNEDIHRTFWGQALGAGNIEAQNALKDIFARNHKVKGIEGSMRQRRDWANAARARRARVEIEQDQFIAREVARLQASKAAALAREDRIIEMHEGYLKDSLHRIDGYHAEVKALEQFVVDLLDGRPAIYPLA